MGSGTLIIAVVLETPPCGEAGSLTLLEYSFATYNGLMKNGGRMEEIDKRNMLAFLRLRAWDV